METAAAGCTVLYHVARELEQTGLVNDPGSRQGGGAGERFSVNQGGRGSGRVAVTQAKMGGHGDRRQLTSS